MGSINLMLYLSIATPLFMMLFICEKKTRRVLFFMLCGISICLISGQISGYLYSLINSTVTYTYFTVNITPTIEELLKSVPIVTYAFVKRHDDRTVLECAIAVGVGFAILENAFVLSSNIDIISIPLALARGFGSGMMHGLCTLAVGYGMTFVLYRRKLFYTGSVALLGAAVMYHSLYNILAQSQYQLVGFILPMLTFIPILIIMKKRDVI